MQTFLVNYYLGTKTFISWHCKVKLYFWVLKRLNEGEMAQWFTALAALLEEPGWIPSIHIVSTSTQLSLVQSLGIQHLLLTS